MKVPSVFVKVLVAAVLMMAAVAVAQAEDKPLFSWERLSFAAGVNYAWHAAPFENAAPVPAFGKEWEAGLYAAYNLTPRLSLAGSSVYGMDNKLVESRVGVRIRLGSGNEDQ